MKIKEKLSPYMFLLPHLTVFAIFFLLPSIFGIYVSFTKWDLFGSPEFVGLENYRTILFDTTNTFHNQFVNGLGNTFKFVIFSVPFLVIIPLFLAVALNEKPKGSKLFQSIFYLPTLFPISAVALIWNFIFDPQNGPVNKIFNLDVLWTSNQPYAWIVIVVVTLWWVIGTNMIIYQAALSGIPKELYEAADIDGANAWQKFFRITLPSIKGQILYTVVTTTVAQFNVYGQPLMLTQGGPDNSTRVLLMDIQELAFGSGQSIAGIASAMAVILGICIMAVSFLQFYLITREN